MTNTTTTASLTSAPETTDTKRRGSWSYRAGPMIAAWAAVALIGFGAGAGIWAATVVGLLLLAFAVTRYTFGGAA